uniref:Uncharacterized protein n=1 Tax=Arundo donax TaxID=35708 RepID=A0A0A9AFE9_ARUDO
MGFGVNTRRRRHRLRLRRLHPRPKSSADEVPRRCSRSSMPPGSTASVG